jgi:hypothetical protein
MKTNVSEINGEARDDLVKVILRVAEKFDPRTATSAICTALIHIREKYAKETPQKFERLLIKGLRNIDPSHASDEPVTAADLMERWEWNLDVCREDWHTSRALLPDPLPRKVKDLRDATDAFFNSPWAPRAFCEGWTAAQLFGVIFEPTLLNIANHENDGLVTSICLGEFDKIVSLNSRGAFVHKGQEALFFSRRDAASSYTVVWWHEPKLVRVGEAKKAADRSNKLLDDLIALRLLMGDAVLELPLEEQARVAAEWVKFWEDFIPKMHAPKPGEPRH